MLRKRTIGTWGAKSYRRAMKVLEVVYYSRYNTTYSMCPRCKKILEREYQSYCDHCGQALDWENLADATLRKI